jgi:perosamine synthetase
MTIKNQLYRSPLLGNVKKYLNDCFDSNWISSKGKFFQEFEQTFAEYIQLQCATTVSNATRTFRAESFNRRDLKLRLH